MLSPLLAPGSPHREGRSCVMLRGKEPPIDSRGPLFQGSVLDQFAGWRVLSMLSMLRALRMLSSGRVAVSQEVGPEAGVVSCSSIVEYKTHSLLRTLDKVLQVQAMITR